MKRYSPTHEWFDDDDNSVGISEHAVQELGDLVFLELPPVGTMVTVGESVAVIESVKAASGINAPLSGEITAVNEALVEVPEALTQTPNTWLFKLAPNAPEELEELMDETGYLDSLEG